MTDNAVAASLERVSVAYGTQWALSEVSAEFPAGAVGLLGPNGAGKSTMLKALLGLIKPDHGTLRVLGLDVATAALEIRARIGYMPENDAQIPGMTAVSFVAYCGELSGLPAADAMQRAHEVLYYVGLGEARYRNVETYSTGMKQRIKLAQALVHDPDLLLLDEPTNGMDPKGREEMLALIRDLAHNKHISLILSSHVMPDVESVCDSVVVMNHGAVVMHGPIATLKGPSGRIFEVRIKGDSAAFAERLHGQAFDCLETDGDMLRVVLPAEAGPEQLFAAAASVGAQVRHLRPSLPTLEDVFARAVGEREDRV
jgi:ABC-2 type transport system ATP-binding protein